MVEQWLGFFRVANVTLGTALFSYCMMRTVRDWPLWTRRERTVRAHLAAYLFVMTVGTAFKLWGVQIVGPVLLVAVHVSFAVSLFVNRNDPVRP